MCVCVCVCVCGVHACSSGIVQFLHSSLHSTCPTHYAMCDSYHPVSGSCDIPHGEQHTVAHGERHNAHGERDTVELFARFGVRACVLFFCARARVADVQRTCTSYTYHICPRWKGRVAFETCDTGASVFLCGSLWAGVQAFNRPSSVDTLWPVISKVCHGARDKLYLKMLRGHGHDHGLNSSVASSTRHSLLGVPCPRVAEEEHPHCCSRLDVWHASGIL